MQQTFSPIGDTWDIQKITAEPSLVTCQKCVWVLRLEYNCG